MTKERKKMVVKVIFNLGKTNPLTTNFITLAEDTKITDKMLNDVYRFLNEKN